MPLDAAQIAERTRKLAILRSKKPATSAAVVPMRMPAQIDPTIVYLKQQVFDLLHVGEVTWKKWKQRGLKPFRCGKSLAVKGASLISVMESQD